MVLEINELTGGYSKEPVIHDISFKIEPGEIIGLIGLNGAGKSTTIKHILGLLRPHKGNVKVMDQTIENDVEAYRRHMGYIPEAPILYEELTLREHINMTAMAYGLTPEQVDQRKGPLLKVSVWKTRKTLFRVIFQKV